MFCFVGLGNPGEEYKATRHNIGFRVIERFAEGARTNIIRRQEYLALTAQAQVCRTKVLLMKPQTYMNKSGHSVAMACQAFSVPPQRVIVAYDDVDLPCGRLRVRSGGGSGGHNGIRSLTEELGSADFIRVRCGIGRPHSGQDTTAHVLGPFADEESATVHRMTSLAAAAGVEVICRGIDAAMQKYNRLNAQAGLSASVCA